MTEKKMMNNEINNTEMEQVNGGQILGRPQSANKKCTHPRKIRTGRFDEDYYCFGLFSHHRIEYMCPDCGSTFWVKENE